MNTTWFDRFLYSLFQSWQLNSLSFGDLWKEVDSNRRLKQIRIALPISGFGYLLHYFFVDGPLGLTSDYVWFYYRFGIFAASMTVFSLSLSSRLPQRLIDCLYWLVAIGTCWAQARSTVWYSGVSPTWGFFIAIIFVFIFRTNTFFQLAMLTVLLAAEWPSFIATNQEMTLIYGSLIVSYFVIFLAGRIRLEEINSFVISQRQVETEKAMFEVQQELADQIKAFLPRKTSKDLRRLLSSGHTVTQAINEVLAPQEKKVACLFSDIRGYTQLTKALKNIQASAMPNIKASTSIVEDFDGIPRVIGDLVFAYFEQQNSDHAYLINALMAGTEIIKFNRLHNASVDMALRISRYVILDCGAAVCGNLGGLHSSREITALGAPVNRCSRIDILTKTDKLRALLGEDALVLSSSFVKILIGLGINIKLTKVNLAELDLQIRDFDDEQEVYFTHDLVTININNILGNLEAA